MKTRNRIEQWYDELLSECTESEIAAGLGNGDIDTPEWMSKSEDVDHVKIWDNESGASQYMGFMTLSGQDEMTIDNLDVGDIATQNGEYAIVLENNGNAYYGEIDDRDYDTFELNNAYRVSDMFDQEPVN